MVEVAWECIFLDMNSEKVAKRISYQLKFADNFDEIPMSFIVPRKRNIL